jgi:hypothetical protein
MAERDGLREALTGIIGDLEVARANSGTIMRHATQPGVDFTDEATRATNAVTAALTVVRAALSPPAPTVEPPRCNSTKSIEGTERRCVLEPGHVFPHVDDSGWQWPTVETPRGQTRAERNEAVAHRAIALLRHCACEICSGEIAGLTEALSAQ